MHGPSQKTRKEIKKDKRSEALRDNLKKRKQQSKARSSKKDKETE